uniref:Uncharacterized protein n=1 Tax=Manihot esculenta TaxID=3983 RepID=A0A2C9V1J6_MANES
MNRFSSSSHVNAITKLWMRINQPTENRLSKFFFPQQWRFKKQRNTVLPIKIKEMTT